MLSSARWNFNGLRREGCCGHTLSTVLFRPQVRHGTCTPPQTKLRVKMPRSPWPTEHGDLTKYNILLYFYDLRFGQNQLQRFAGIATFPTSSLYFGTQVTVTIPERTFSAEVFRFGPTSRFFRANLRSKKYSIQSYSYEKWSFSSWRRN